MLDKDNPLDVFKEAGEIFGKAAQMVDNIEHLSTADVNRFLEMKLRADVVLEDLPPDFVGNHSIIKNSLEESLSAWDTDRTDALFHLVQYIETSKKSGMLNMASTFAINMASTFARCSQALLQEPLIPSLNPEKYTIASNTASLALTRATKAPTDLVDILTAYSSGITYNAHVFCTQIYQEKITPDDVEQALHIFQNNLLIIQGKDQF